MSTTRSHSTAGAGAAAATAGPAGPAGTENGPVTLRPAPSKGSRSQRNSAAGAASEPTTAQPPRRSSSSRRTSDDHPISPSAVAPAPAAARHSGGSPPAAAAAAPAEAAAPAAARAAAAAADAYRYVQPQTARIVVKPGLLTRAATALGIPPSAEFVSNEITTSKYTALTFLPVNLFEQFLRIANLYFLLTAILQLIPGLSPTSWFTTVCPLVIVLGVNAIKEGLDDLARHRSDAAINSRTVLVLSAEHGERPVQWRDVQVGDLVKVQQDEEIPADLVFLSSSDKEDLCYVETANLDGETNLKIKYSCAATAGLGTAKELAQFAATSGIYCEQPNPRLYVFDGYTETAGRKAPLVVANLLLRGSSLRKTAWAVGVAAFTGPDTKIMQNMTKAPRKVTQLERHMNLLVLGMFGVLLVASCLLAMGQEIWLNAEDASSWYLMTSPGWPELPPGFTSWIVQVLRFIIVLSNLIPISLYVTLEVVKVLQCTLLLDRDREMYHKDSDSAFVCRTTTLNEELGQVEYVLSDKTGTLTQNVMGFVWASVGQQLYGRNQGKKGLTPDVPLDTPHSIALDVDLQRALGGGGGGGGSGSGGRVTERDRDPAMDAFLVNLAVCNTVVPTRGPAGEWVYQASSPDEEALVQGAAYLGYSLEARSTDKVMMMRNGHQRIYDVLAILEFNSDRKRMSIITRTPEGTFRLYCKGADTVILARLKPGQATERTLREHLDEMARSGYRTLLAAYKDLSAAEYNEWSALFHDASVALDDREAKIAAVSELIETDLMLLGATAVEDKLQDGVPECIAALAASGIKVWVLTGDKVETAISISYSCKLFTEDMTIVQLREHDFPDDENISDAEMDRQFVKVLEKKQTTVRDANRAMRMAGERSNVGIVVEGSALALCLRPAVAIAFLDLCKQCKSVVCCRVSPMQKAQVTNLVKKKAGAITLGIGDGANDVGMIRAAHIGVGISGREGRAAVLASDFSFGQFRYLSRLLLLHGRWAYKRNSEVVKYSFYKNWAYTLCYVYLAFMSGFSAQPIFTTMEITCFNLIFTSCPIVAYAVLEQDLSADTIMRNPQLYDDTRTQTRRSFFKSMLWHLVLGSWHSLPVYFIPMYSLTTVNQDGRAADLETVGTAIFLSLVLVVNLSLAARTRYWTWITHVLMWALSLGLLVPFVVVLGLLFPAWNISGVSDMTDMGPVLFSNPVFWLGAVICGPALCLLLDVAVAGMQRWFAPREYQLLQEQELRISAGRAFGQSHRSRSQQQMEMGAMFGQGQGAAAGGAAGKGGRWQPPAVVA